MTYRRANGSMVNETVEAADRAGCFAQMKARGIAPTNVKEDGQVRQAGRSSGRNQAKTMGGGSAPRGRALPWVMCAFVLILAGGVLWWLGRDSPQPTQNEVPIPKKSSSLAKEVKPAKAPKPVEQVPVAEPVVPPLKRELTTKEKLERLEISLTNAYKAAEARKIRFIPSKRRQNRIFTEIADLQVERLLSIEPGRIFLGTVNYDRFEENFKKALETPITVEPDDSEKVRAMKEAVIETRKDLKRRMDAGEDIGKVMRETEDELHRLASYRFNLETELRKARGDGSFSGEDLKDYVEAANSILRQNGLPELKFPEIWYQNAKLRQMQGEKQK